MPYSLGHIMEDCTLAPDIKALNLHFTFGSAQQQPFPIFPFSQPPPSFPQSVCHFHFHAAYRAIKISIFFAAAAAAAVGCE